MGVDKTILPNSRTEKIDAVEAVLREHFRAAFVRRHAHNMAVFVLRTLEALEKSEPVIEALNRAEQPLRAISEELFTEALRQYNNNQIGPKSRMENALAVLNGAEQANYEH